MTKRSEEIRNHALTIIELMKGWTPEQRKTMSSAQAVLEGLALDVLELTDEKLVFAQVGVCPSCGSSDIKEIKIPLNSCKNCGCEWK